MDVADRLERVRLLVCCSRFDLAEEGARKVLAAEPENPGAHAYLALALIGRNRRAAAVREAKEAVRLNPNYAYGQYVLAFTSNRMGLRRPAERAIAAAMQLDPVNPGFTALRASMALETGHAIIALRFAEDGLKIDPGHVESLINRAIALRMLKKHGEFKAAAAALLARVPDNPSAQATHGWMLIDDGRPKEAIAHFQEALRLAPEMGWAREGVAQAITRGLPGLRLVFKVLVKLANPSIVIILPILPVIFLVPILGLLADVFSNLVFRLHPLGRRSLNAGQIAAANWTLLCLVVTAAGVGIFLATTSQAALDAGLLGAFMIAPLNAANRAPLGERRRILSYMAAGLAGLGFLAMGTGLAGAAGPEVAVFRWSGGGFAFCYAWARITRTRG